MHLNQRNEIDAFIATQTKVNRKTRDRKITHNRRAYPEIYCNSDYEIRNQNELN